MMESVRCEVLNVTYEPLKPVSVRRATRLLLDGKATLLEEHPTLFMRSAHDIFPVPVQIILHKLIKTGNRNVTAPLTRRNLMVRDSFTCQYCGRHEGELHRHEEMTRDHIHPRDKGGLDKWMNVVLACNTCNNKKANYFLHEVNMKIRREPTIPTAFELAARARHEKEKRKSR